jgi:hypothetical protein
VRIDQLLFTSRKQDQIAAWVMDDEGPSTPMFRPERLREYYISGLVFEEE